MRDGYQFSLDKDLSRNLMSIKNSLHGSAELIIREMIAESDVDSVQCRMAVLYMDGLADRLIINEYILQPLLAWKPVTGSPAEVSGKISTGAILRSNSMEEALEHLINSSTIILIDGFEEVIIICTEGWEHRAVSAPATESSILGPQDSFNEVLRVNTALLRRRIKDSRLVVATEHAGKRSKTCVTVMYLEDVVNPKMVDEVKRRLDEFDGDMLVDSSQLAEILEDQPWSPFPQIAYTERVDRTAAAIMEGRVAVLVDGTPFALYMPITFAETMFSNDDYYTKFYFATFIRWIRVLALIIALLLPSIYIAVSSFHQEMVPTELMIMMAANRTGVPFPTLVEAFLIETTFELLREASIRMPGSFGQTIGIVGALVIGQAAVQANLIGPVLTVIVSFTAIGSFVIPSYQSALALRMLRFPMMILAGTMGLFGIIVGCSLILIHMVRIHSFGIPYMTAFTPDKLGEIDDSLLLKKPGFLQLRRPGFLKPQQMVRRSKRN
ncbi:spore germination protein [Paenibacillus sp. HB172176]|uniref:spore germination protein n=1 Tax=Paenibacillus sp. HB172176 TaxID=2493690 RepID=UPI001439F5F4|nr:spore germination protein [Paenibacillus sp. HB172176]